MEMEGWAWGFHEGKQAESAAPTFNSEFPSSSDPILVLDPLVLNTNHL